MEIFTFRPCAHPCTDRRTLKCSAGRNNFFLSFSGCGGLSINTHCFAVCSHLLSLVRVAKIHLSIFWHLHTRCPSIVAVPFTHELIRKMQSQNENFAMENELWIGTNQLFYLSIYLQKWKTRKVEIIRKNVLMNAPYTRRWIDTNNETEIYSRTNAP